MIDWAEQRRRQRQEYAEAKLRRTADRWRPQIEEWTTSTGAGREVVLPVPMNPVPCATCWQQRVIWEPGPLGLVPVVCDGCDGRGWR